MHCRTTEWESLKNTELIWASSTHNNNNNNNNNFAHSEIYSFDKQKSSVEIIVGVSE